MIKNIYETEKKNDNINNDGKITAVIPVRKGSTRCKNKNIRNFEDTNLLKLKIETLKKVKSIDRILVSSNCDIMLGIAQKLGVEIHKRDEVYCTTLCSGSDMYCALASAIKTEYMLYTHCVAPFILPEIYEDIIKIYKMNKYDSIMTSHELKEYLWYKNKPLNYEYDNAPPSQTINGYYIPTFGACLVRKDFVLKNRNIIGFNPYFYKVDMCKSLDIDYEIDFITCELLYKNNILNDDTCKMILEKRTDKILLLDCTIRDGGYLNNWEFSYEEVLDCYKAVTEAGYTYFEIGFRTNKELLPNKGKWCYSTENDINQIYKKYNGCKIAVMAKIGTVTINDFIKKKNSNITMVRVLINRSTQENGVQKSYYNHSDIREAKNFCKQLIDYGYEVCMNFPCGDIINEDEIKIIVSEFYNVNLKALYLADTYGGFNSYNVPIQLHKFYSELNKYNSNLSFGFHSHNNNEDAFSKTTTAIYHGCTMIDSCIGGLGRGAGNLKSEQLMSYLYKDNTEYINKITPLIIYIDKHIISKKEYINNNYMQSHPYYMISGKLSLHPNYILEILHMNTNIINDIKLIFEIDKITKNNKSRHYDKKLITNITKFI